MVVAAFVVSNLINVAYVYWVFGFMPILDRYGQALQPHGLYDYLLRLLNAFLVWPRPLYFETGLIGLWVGMAALALVSIVRHALSRRNKDHEPSQIGVLLYALAVLGSAPVIVNASFILGVQPPIRSLYVIGWMVAASYLIAVVLNKDRLLLWTRVMAVATIILGSAYVSVFFDAARRQTESDIIRANQIVAEIRRKPSYASEPVRLKIVGQKTFPVPGWKFGFGGFAEWSKYGILSKFTDMTFDVMDDTELQVHILDLLDGVSEVKSYPEKPSIFVKNGRVLVVLDPKELQYPVNRALFWCSKEVTFHNEWKKLQLNSQLRRLIPNRSEGMRLRAIGRDPIMIIGSIDLTPARYILHIEMRSSVPSEIQVFYPKKGGQEFSEERSIRNTVRVGDNEFYIMLPMDVNARRLRVDPLARTGIVEIKRLEIRKVGTQGAGRCLAPAPTKIGAGFIRRTPESVT